MIRRAIILAAGRGARLGDVTTDTPKCLLPLGDGTILSRQLDACVETGIDDVVLVTGFEWQQIDAEVARWQEGAGKGARVSSVYNPFFATTNNMYSLAMARHRMDEDFLVINADNVFATETLRAVARDGDAPIVVSVAERASYDEEDMKVLIEDGRVREIAKTIPLNEANGESLGIRAFAGEGRQLLSDELEAMNRDSDPAKAWYITAVARIAKRGGPVGVLYVDADSCMDVDFAKDLEQAQRDFG